MVGEMFEIYWSQMTENALESSTIIGEMLEIYLFQMAKNASESSTWLEKCLKFTHLKWLKIHLNQ